MSAGRHTVYNIIGAVTSLSITVVTVPLYIHQIGEARYGVLAIVWLLLGYFGLFDFGLSRATAQAVAASESAGARKQSDIVWGALLANAAFGSLGGIVLWAAARWIFGHFVSTTFELRGEVLDVLPWIAACVPVATTTSIFQGALQGRSRFLELNSLSVLGVVLFQAIPVCVAYAVGPDLRWIIPAAVAARVASSLPFALVCWLRLPLNRPRRSCLAEIKTLLRYGAWVSGASIVGPLLASADRLIIGAISGPQAVSYYAVPFSLAERLNIFPGSLAQALFPKFAANRDASYAKRLAEDAVLTVSALLAPVTCFGIAVLPCFLAVWINKGFAEHSYFAGQILLVGIWLNGAAIVPLARLQAIGRPDLPLKLYLIEIVPYVLCLWWGLSQFGVAGAALAWTIRAAVDMVLMTRAAKLPAGTIFRLIPNFALTVLTVLVGNLPSSFGHIWAYQTAMAILSGALSWRQLPDQARDAIVGQYFRARRTIKMYSCS